MRDVIAIVFQLLPVSGFYFEDLFNN